MLSSIERGLARPWYRLRLPEPLEARYAAQGAAGSARRIRSWLLVFIAFNVLSVKVDLDMFGAEAVVVPAALTLCLFVPLALLAILALRHDAPPARQTAAVMVTSLVDMAITLNSALIAPGRHADVYLILAAIIPLVVGMIAALSFRHAILYCGTCFALYVTAVVGLELGGPDGVGIPLLVASLILVPLKLAYAHEWETKQSFLLGLREQMQADALTEANSRLTVLSETDPLTGIANRRLFGERLGSAWESAIGERGWLGLALIDVDHFKAFNDAAGHAEGDRCLREVAGALHSAVTARGGLLARYGGEEFVALLPDATPEAVIAAGEALHRAIAELALPHPGFRGDAVVSASVGVTSAHGATRRWGVGPDDLLAAADRALYEAKRNGRDRVEAACVRSGAPALAA
ncbi:GGDEF domain-containing protein [Methylobacterium haplocladii]|uniref:diguanylate cyclase n=1 Tax=Methylobacterium haplocladii TaxID=1176176 RepID=A0A512INV2_9HYPH|nr:diguanylate cyclase [Methylobacterium haplocladii]GEO99389.1 GGDEF domain-containing protein [Methylobacterium haplocladii]GJD83406.1 hypothetical protein HPGCJGGD_1272 [Methylobacterium haplocladii]GLS60263.1 GGDEF domain-containing protein [Methylobacterium haplocladii]